MKKNRERLEGEKKSLLLGIHENTEIIVLRGAIKIFHNRLQRIYATFLSLSYLFFATQQNK